MRLSSATSTQKRSANGKANSHAFLSIVASTRMSFERVAVTAARAAGRNPSATYHRRARAPSGHRVIKRGYPHAYRCWRLSRQTCPVPLGAVGSIYNALPGRCVTTGQMHGVIALSLAATPPGKHICRRPRIPVQSKRMLSRRNLSSLAANGRGWLLALMLAAKARQCDGLGNQEVKLQRSRNGVLSRTEFHQYVGAHLVSAKQQANLTAHHQLKSQ